MTNIEVNNEIVEVVNKAKFLGTHIKSDLKWDRNTSKIVKKNYKRMQILYKAAIFTKNKQDLKRIYKIFVRSILEHLAVVWDNGLTNKNILAIERVQKSAVKLIMGAKYTNYSDGLKDLNLENLEKKEIIFVYDLLQIA